MKTSKEAVERAGRAWLEFRWPGGNAEAECSCCVVMCRLCKMRMAAALEAAMEPQAEIEGGQIAGEEFRPGKYGLIRLEE